MAERPLYTLYKNLKAQNYDVPDDYNKFESALTRDGKGGADNRHAIYENLKAQNFDVPNTYERFYSALFEPRSKTSSRAKGGSVPMSAADRARFSAGAAAISASASNAVRQAKRNIQTKLGQAKKFYGGRVTPRLKNPLQNQNVQKNEFNYNSTTGKTGTYTTTDGVEFDNEYDAAQYQNRLDKQGEQYINAVNAGEIPSAFDVRDKNGNYDLQENINKNGTYLTEEGARNQFDKKLADAYARKKEIEALIAEDHRQHGNPLLSYGASIGASNGRTAEQSDYSNKLATSLALVKQQIGALEAVKQYPTSSWGEDALKALDNTAFTAKTWDFGLTDFATMGQMERIKTKMENNLPLSGSDKMLLKSKLGADAAAALEDEKMGNIYRWTKIAGQSLPFMADFFLTGGYGGITKTISRGALKFAAKRGMGKVSAAILKNTGIVAGDVIGSYAMAGSEQAMKTGADIMQRHLGSLYQNEKGDYKFGTFDENGNLLHEGGESMGTALYKGLTSAMVENYTEKLFGHSYGIKKGAINFMEKHGMNASAEFFKNIGKSGWYTNSKKWMEKFGINGFGEEVMEEEIGIPLHALLDGDNKFSDLLDTKQQLDIIGGMALSVGSMYAMGAGSRPVKGVYNRAQYYRFRNKVNVADSDAQNLMGDKWADIKDKIDNSTNEQMGGVLADILRQRDTMSKEQINAAINYGINLMKMRGYNVAKTAEMNAREITNEPTTPEEQHQEDIDNAYSEGHDADDADKHDIQLEHEDQMKTLAGLLNISEQQLSAMNDDELQSLTGQNDKLDQAIYDYQLSSARYQGVTDDALDKIDMAANQAAQRVDMYTDKSRGSVRNATVKASGGAEDYGVYIISGNIATNEDGSINVADSDDMILFYDPTTNSVEHADALRFAELGDEVPADDVKAQAVADAKEKAIKEVASIVDGTIDVGSQFKVTGADGLEHTYEILADYGDGTAAISIDGNVVENPYSLEDLQHLKDLEDQKRLEAAKAQREQMEMERAEQTQETEQPEEIQPSLDFNQILNDDGNVVLVDVLDKDGNTKYPDSRLFLIRDTGAKAKVVELKSDGTFVPHAVSKKNVATISSMSLDEYKQAMAETSMIEENSGAIEGDRGGIEVNDELLPVPDNVTINGDGTYSVDGAVQGGENTTAPAEQTEQTPAMTLEDGTIVPMLEDGNPDFSKLTADQTAELYDSQFGEDADSVISGWVSDAKKALDKANNMTVKGKNFVEQKAAKEAKEKAIADAQATYDSAVAIRDAYNERQLAKVEDTAEGRKELIEKARRKFARLKSAVKDDAEAVSQLYKDVVGSLLHRLYDGTGIDVTDTIPLTAEEYVASNLGAHSLNYEGTEISKGVKQETGLSREDFAKTQLLAADGKGTTIDDLVHSLWENRPSNLESLDTQDIRNALIGVLNSGFKASEARNYIENLRIAQAENILEEQKKAAENAAFAEEQKAESEQQTETAPESEEKTGEDNSDEINDEENEQTNENTNAPEVPEDATEENPLGAQRDQTYLPFSAKENGKQQTTAERAADVEKNKVDDMKVVDNIVGEKTRKAFERLAKMMGASIQWQYSDKLGNGWIQKTTDADGNVHRTIFITLDSSITEGAQFIFGHEMTHQIKKLNPAAYNELTQLVLDTYGSDAFDKAVDETMNRYSDVGFSGRARDYYAEEVVADAVGEMIRDLNLAHTLAMKMSHPLLAAIHEILQKIKLAFYGTEYNDVTKNIIRSIEQAYVKTAKGEVTNSETGEDVSFSLRQKPEPKKKGIGYKVFVLKDGKLYPPMVANPDGAATPVGVWLDADAAPITGESKTGRPQVKQGGKGTQGGSGKLAYRPGWHLGVVPYAIQFNRKDAEGNKTLFPKNFVFAEVEYAADVDYQEEARQEGINPSGKYQHSLAGLKHLPTDGYYMYRTNPNPETDPWVITGAMKVNRILTRAEQAELVKNAGREPQQIQDGDIVTDDVVNSINQEIAAAPKFSLKVYHGSGADFTEFDFIHMGEGAGSQVFGWGGYVTSSKKIGKNYATLMDNDPSRAYFRIQRSNGTRFAKKYPTLESFLHGDKQIAMNDKFTEQEKIDFYNEMKKLAEPYHNLYEVDIPDDNGSNYMDWDKPLSKNQQDAIREGLEHLGVGIKTLESKGQSLERTGENVYNSTLYIGLTGTEYDLPERTKGISKFLSSVGFTGIKYKAGRNFGGAKKGDTNYVIFKPEDMRITEHTKFSLKSKPVRFEAGKKLSDEEKKEVLSTLKDAYKVNGVPYHIEETAGGKEKRVYEPTADSYIVSDITNRPLRYYITLPDGRVAHPTEVYPNISDNEVKSSATKQGLLDEEVDQIVSAAIGNMKDIADNAKAVEILNELQNLPHETHDVGYGLNHTRSYNYKTGIFTSDAAQAIDYVVRRMRRKEDVPAEIPAALKKAVADSYGMVDNLIDGMINTKVGAAEIKPVGVGAFGNIYNQFRGKAKAAIEFLKKLGSGEAAAALQHHTIGDISLVWGDKKTGLDKILRKHPEVVDNLQSIIDSMEVVQESDNRIKLESPTHFAVVSKEYKGEPREQWLLTAYEKRESLENGKSMDTATSSLGGDTALSQSKESAAKIDNSSETAKENGEKFSLKDEKIKSVAEKFGVNEDDVAMYANAVERGSTAEAARARANIKRYLLQANEDKISSFKDIIKYTKPINEALKENFGDLDAMIEERRKQVEAQRNAMEAARKRAQEEEEKRQKHLDELSLIPTDELDKRYMDAIANNDESTAREMLDESARRNGYGDVDSDYQGQGAWAAPSNPQYESDEARRADIENSPDVNLEDIALGYNLQPDDYFDNPRAYMNNTAYGLESAHVIKNALDAIKNGEKDVKVKVYRAVPTSVKEGKLRNGDWVTPSKKYAEMHGDNRLDGKYRIIEDEVPANQLWWDGNDVNEFGFDDGKEYRYKNAKNNRKLNDLITYDNKGNVIPPSKRFNSRKSDIRFSLAGERGAAAADKAEERTARMDNLSVARKMEEEKKDAKAIKMATGWERGADGKWRYEMPDAKIKDTMDVGGGHIVKRYEDDMLWNGGKLSKVIDAPELFKAYPQLKDVRIDTDAIMNDMPSNGEYNAKTNTITIHADELKYMNSILNHEIQHVIQSIEGFDRGGSPRLVRGEIKKRLAEVTKQIRQLRAEGKEDEAKAIVEKNRGLYNAYQANDDYNSYKSLAGEVEARNVQERMNMSPEERRRTLAESTEDVARKDQIFLGVGDVSFSLRDMADGKESGAADMAEDLKSLNTPGEVDDAINTAIDDMPSGWQMANKKMIHIAQALGENRKAEIAGVEPKFSLKDGSLIKAGTYFSGGGLVEEGLKGIIDPVVAVEYDEKISGVYRNNFGQHIVTADVRDVDPKELVKQIDGEVEYFHASPVCKNYSQAKSNHTEVELDKETAASTAEFINAVKPKVVTIENVKGYKDSDAMKIITDALDANGYTWDADVYNAADYGGYTNRERLIVRAVRDGKLPEKPKKMAHKSGWYEAVADIIPTLTEKKNGVANWMDIRLKADGIDWRNIDKPLYVMGSAYADGKIPHAFADELLPTLRTKSGDVIVMPDGKVYRAMGRVLARVSGVSDDYKMPFSENLSHTIIGNGIPTQLTEHVIAPLLQNTLHPTTPEDGNTKFSLRYDKFEHDLNQWKKDNNLPKDAQRPTIPQRNAGESAVDFLRRVDEYRKQMALWKTAPTYEQHLLSDDTALGEFNRELQKGSVLKRIAFQDSMLAIRKAQEAIMKEVGVDRLNMAEDAYTAENRSHGKGKNEFEEYNNEFLQPLRKAYHQMKKVLGDSYDNVRVYMMAKHGLERDAQMAFKKSLESDYEDVNQRSAAYKAYKNDLDRVSNDADLEFGRVDFTTWRQKDNALRGKYSPSYMDYRYDDNGIAYDYSGLSSLFDGSDFEEAAHRLVRDVETKHLAEAQALWNATNAATKKILRDGFKAGMMSKDAYEYVKGMYSHYIPLRGWDGTTADQVWDYIGGGKGAFNQTLKNAHGRTSIADDPIAYIENMAESGILLNNKNWVKQHLMLLAQNHPTSLLTLSKAWYVKSTDANGNEEWIPATPQITSQMNSNQVKAAIDAFEQKMEQMAQTGDATQQRDGLNIAYPQTHSEEREHEVRVMKDGEEYVIYVNGDPQLAQAMNNTRAHRVREIQSGKLDRAAAWLGRKMAAAYTSLSPLFIPSNYFRDLTMTLASTAIREDGRYNYLLRKNLATSWNLGFMLRDYQNGKLREKVSNGNATAKEQMFYDFMMNGGETGFVSSLDVEDLKKKFKNDLKDLDRWKANPVKVGHTIMDGIEFLNRAIEDSNRFAVYMTSIQYGRSIDEAVNDAKDVTLNFNRKGTGEYGWQMIRNLYLFINPAVQSLQTLGALAKHHPFKFTAVTAAWLASGVLVPIVNAALMSLLGGDDKDKYWQFSKWDRRNNFIMWVPTTHEFVKIPLAQEFRAFYGVGDMIASKMMGGELAEETWSQYAEDLLGQVVDMFPLDPTGYDGNIAVSLMPNPIRPVFELAFNVDFTGKPLFKDTEYNKYDPNFTKAYVGTPDWLVRVSKMVNSIGNDYPDVQQNAIDAFGDPRYNLNNPAVVDHVLSSYLGGAYTMGSQVLGVLTKSLNDPKEIKMADIPLVSKFVSNPDDRPVTKKQGDEFWNMKENHDRAANTLSKLKKQAKMDGDYSMLERFYGSEEYKQYKQEDVKVKKYEEDKKKERAEESGEEYRPHKLNAEDIYKAHATPKDDFEDLKLKQLYTKLNGFKTSYDLLVDTAPSQSDGYYNTNKAAIDAIDEISIDKQEISELKKGFLDDGKDAYNAEDMKRIRELRKRILSVLEPANKVVVANQKAKAEKK
jgi:site-specific DNA-cytosine methylase